MASKSRIIAETQMGGHSNQTGAFDMPVGTTAQRPSAPSSGFTRMNTDTNTMEMYNGTQWVTVGGTDMKVYAVSPTTVTTAGTTVTIDFDDSTGPASERVKFGDDDDLQLYHDGTHSYVNHNGTGDLLISGNNDVDITATTDIGITGGGNVLMNGVTGVDVQFNGTTRFSSTNTGIGINGDIVDSSGGMTGSLTFPAIGGNIATEGFGIALAVALG